MAMNRDGKIWVIEDDETPEGMLEAAAAEADEERPLVLETAPLLGPARSPRENVPSQARGLLRRILATYFLGPLAPGARHALWTPLALIAFALPLFLLGAGLLDASELARGRPVGLVLHGLAVGGLFLALGIWSSALARFGVEARARRRDLPWLLRRPGFTAFAGLCLPGFALLLAGRSRRAALALWNLAPLACALYLLLNPGRSEGWTLWIGYERMLLAALVVALVAGLLWLGLALEGLRLQLANRSAQGGLRADRLVLWLMASLALFAFAFQPVTSAEDLHREAGALAGRGFRLLPLLLESAALRLDDSRPQYWLQTADYCERLGRGEQAARLRGTLWLRWHELGNSLESLPCTSSLPIRVEAAPAPRFEPIL